MKVGIMQPYFVPYIGYWQLIHAVDKYVIYDDVNFIKRGWINRNRILYKGEPRFINIPMLGMSQNKRINEVEVNQDPKMAEKNIRLLQEAYRKAPYFSEVYPVIEKIINCRKENLAEYIIYSLSVVCDYLDIKTELIVSSSLEKNNHKRGQDKIIEICELLNATEYYNAIGGTGLYSSQDFESKKIQLRFLKTGDINYQQFDNEFQPNLSIVDILMFNRREKVKEYLNDYILMNG